MGCSCPGPGSTRGWGGSTPWWPGPWPSTSDIWPHRDIAREICEKAALRDNFRWQLYPVNLKLSFHLQKFSSWTLEIIPDCPLATLGWDASHQVSSSHPLPSRCHCPMPCSLLSSVHTCWLCFDAKLLTRINSFDTRFCLVTLSDCALYLRLFMFCKFLGTIGTWHFDTKISTEYCPWISNKPKINMN